MKALLIREARPEDLASIQEIFQSHHPNPDWEYAHRYLHFYFNYPDYHPTECMLVGLVENRILGIIGYLQDRRGIEDIYWLGWFYVHRDAKGNNYGTQLLNRVISEVKKRGARKLYTDTSSDYFYDRAHHRYKQYGFKKEGKLRDYYEEGEHQVIYGMSLTEDRLRT